MFVSFFTKFAENVLLSENVSVSKNVFVLGKRVCLGKRVVKTRAVNYAHFDRVAEGDGNAWVERHHRFATNS